MTKMLIKTLIVICGLSWFSISYAKTFVLLTVDVESYSNGNPSKQIWGEVDNTKERYGIEKIMNVLDSFGEKGTFYLNVYEITRHGEEPIKRAAREIHNRGHDLQLHTHPKPMYGYYVMADANEEKQEEILAKGIELIKKWTDKRVIAHRAGAYGANPDTLRAMKSVDLQIDSSLSPASSSPLAKSGYFTNSITKINGVVELPVTYYIQTSFWGWNSYRILDIEGSTYEEIKSVIRQAADNNLCAVNIMMHSFSLNRYGYAETDVVKRLEDVLRFIKSQPDVELVTVAELYEHIKNDNSCFDQKNIVPYTGYILTYLRAVEDFDKGWKNKAVTISGVVGIGIFLMLVFFGIKRAYKRFAPRR